jgi:translation initiation factor 6
MFVKGNSELTFLPVDTHEKLESHVRKFLGTEVVKTTVAQSNLLGIYLAINSNGIILPNVASEEEIGRFKSLGLNVYVSKDPHNAHGNNIVVNDKGGIINPRIEDAERKRLSDALGVELVPAVVAGYHTVGSACLATDKGFLAHYSTGDNEMKVLEDALKVSGLKGTANTGVGFVSYGMVANSKGYIAGENTTAFELGRLIEAMGFIE